MSSFQDQSGSSSARQAPAAKSVFAPIETRRAPLVQNSYDATARTVKADLSAGSPVRRWGFVEKLEISEEAIDLGRVERGLVSLLDTHNAYELNAVLGRLVEARIESGKLVGKFQFADTEAGRAAEGMVARGEIKGVSIGYRITKWEVDEGDGDELETRTATRWELLEVSLVPVPADAEAGIRSLSGDLPAPPPSQPEEERTMAFTARDGVAMIDSVRSFGPAVEQLARDLVDKIVDGETSPEAARAELLRAAGEAQAARTAGISAGSFAGSDRTFDNPTFRGTAMADALFARMTGKEPSEPGREYMRLTIPQMAAEILVGQGERAVHRMSANDAIRAAWNTRAAGDAQGMITTSNLPGILQSSGNRFILERFAAFESPIKKVARMRSANDFRDIIGIDLSEFDELRKVNENGELEFGTVSERSERYRLSTYGRRYSLSRQALINDDLGLFSDMLSGLAQKAARKEARLLADLINSNPAMADGKAVFHADHGNLAASGAVPSVAAFDEARKTMRAQKDGSGEPIVVNPKFVLANPEYETTLEVLTASTIAAATTDAVNPFSGKLSADVDPLLDAGAWYIFSDPAIAPALEYAYLDGESAPHIEMNEVWETLGTGFRAYHDFGCGFVDHRAAFKNPGA